MMVIQFTALMQKEINQWLTTHQVNITCALLPHSLNRMPSCICLLHRPAAIERLTLSSCFPDLLFLVNRSNRLNSNPLASPSPSSSVPAVVREISSNVQPMLEPLHNFDIYSIPPCSLYSPYSTLFFVFTLFHPVLRIHPIPPCSSLFYSILFNSIFFFFSILNSCSEADSNG